VVKSSATPTATPRCRPHRDGCRRAIGPAGRNEWIPLSKINHAAFDANLIGIDPDFRIVQTK